MSHVKKNIKSYKRTIERSTNERHPLVFISAETSHLWFRNRSSHDDGESEATIFPSFALNQSHDRKRGGGMMQSHWIRSMSWIDWGGYDGSLGALNDTLNMLKLVFPIFFGIS